MSARFELLPETFRDANTGHEWTVQVGELLPLAAAHAYARDCRAGGYDDWRVPEVGELLTLVDHSTYSPATWPELRPVTPVDWYWTATPYAPSSAYAWDVDFTSGYTYSVRVTFTRRVRCVR